MHGQQQFNDGLVAGCQGPVAPAQQAAPDGSRKSDYLKRPHVADM